MDKAKMDKLIVKLIDNAISDHESEMLAVWLEKAENLNYFNDFIKVNQLINSVRKFDYSHPIRQIEIKPKKQRKYLYVAASIVVFISLGLFIKNKFNTIEKTAPTIVNNQIKPGGNRAILTLETGKKIVLDKEKVVSFQTQNTLSSGETIVYNNNNFKKTAYNYLTTPRGGHIQLMLSDSTRIWLNSDTQIKYPSIFVDGEDRMVELVYGEAYFEVSPSKFHKGTSFKVYHAQQEVEVLGTKFNIKSYSDETNIYTTLAEGKVVVHYNGKTQNLMPGQQFNLDVRSKSMSISEVDVDSEILWKDGYFSFKGKTLEEIMKVLSRWYDFNVIFQDDVLKDITFKGVLSKNQNIIDIMTSITKSSSIKNFEINNKSIIIK